MNYFIIMWFVCGVIIEVFVMATSQTNEENGSDDIFITRGNVITAIVFLPSTIAIVVIGLILYGLQLLLCPLIDWLNKPIKKERSKHE